MTESVWHVVVCPDCQGKGKKWVDYQEEWHSGFETCSGCDGKKFVKIDVTKLKER